MNENAELATKVTMSTTELTPELEEELKNMTIRQQLWKVSPEINCLVFKNFLKEHRPDLNWMVPIGAFGLAVYLVKSNKVDLKNIEKLADEKLGIKIDPEGVKRFAANVGIASVIFAGTKVVGKMFFKKDESKENVLEKISLKDLSFNNINDMINEAKSLKTLKPKAEELLPISLSVITLCCISRPIKEVKALTWLKKQLYSVFGSFAITVSEMFDNAVLMIASKLNVDMSEDEDIVKIKKFIILAVISTILIITYGRSISKNDTKKKALNSFFMQVLEGMKKMAPAVFATIVAILVEKNIISEDDIPDEILEEGISPEVSEGKENGTVSDAVKLDE